MVRMNILLEMPADTVVKALRDIHPDAIVVVYHDAGALALDAASRSSLAITARLLADVGLPPSSVDP
jgi:4-hydroxy-L-threonine phosphate dehydrogenase PdxA